MKILNIKRTYLLEQGTFGVIDLEGIPFALTLEKKWAFNKPNESCILKGEYLCKRKISPNFGETFEVINVPNRSDILFHKGNTQMETRGCILLGEEFGEISGYLGVLASGKAFSEFLRKLLGENEFKLVITEV